MVNMSTVYLIAGDNTSLLSRKIDALLETVLAQTPDADVVRVTSVDELSNAVSMPSMLASLQVVVLQATLTAAQQTKIPALVEEASDDTIVIMALPKPSAPVKKAVQAVQGEIIDVVGKSHKDTAAVLLANTQVSLSPSAKALIAEHVGQEVEQIPPLLDALSSMYGDAGRIDVDAIRPFLSDKGAVPVWELTDAIDQANAAKALGLIDRLLWTNNPYALLSVITAHMERLFRTAELGFKNEAVAAEFFGMKGSTYPAKKAIQTAGRYGVILPDLMALVAKAGNDMRGATGVPPRVVLEVLVGRLCTYPRRR